MSHEFEPRENSRFGLRTDLETLAALREGLFETIETYYQCPDELTYADVAGSQLALARQVGDTIDTIFYCDEFSTYDKFSLVRDLQITEDTARIDFLNELVLQDAEEDDEFEDVFHPAHAPELEEWFPEGVLNADPEMIDFEQFRNYEIFKFLEHTNSDMKTVLIYAIHRWSIN